MARKRIEQLKPVSLLIAFLALWWLVPSFLRSFSRASFFEFQAPFNAAHSHLQDLQTYWELRSHSDEELIEAGRDIARQRAFYELNNQQLESLRTDLARLENLHKLPPNPQFRYEIARVAKRDLSAWWQQMIVRKGRNYDIPVGAAVVYGEGVVGRIREVHAYESVVEIVSSPGFRMASHIEGDPRPVTYQGFLNPTLAPPIGKVLNIPPEIQISPLEPKRLLSSTLGGIFPEGLTIGYITDLEPGPDGFFQKGKVQLDGDLSSLREVTIIVPIQLEELQNEP